MSPYSYYRFYRHDEQLAPILEDGKEESSPSTGIMWKYVVGGLVLGSASYSFARAMRQWIIVKVISTDMPIDSRTPTVYAYTSGGIVLLSNAVFLYKLICGKPTSSDVDASVGGMIGFFLAWLILSFVWYRAYDFTPVALIATYAFVYHRFQKQREREGVYHECPMV
jgi:hypothetical protein